tara:strand:+ start:340 stop:468 length:129 start_codon:yes stop_codon:yes gene_type:complete
VVDLREVYFLLQQFHNKMNHHQSHQLIMDQHYLYLQLHHQRM